MRHLTRSLPAARKGHLSLSISARTVSALFLAGLVLFAGAAGSALAQAYPARPIRMIVTFPPAGPMDVLGRMLAQSLSQGLGQPVVVDNRGGAAGTIGMEAIAKAPPDGYTIGFASLSSTSIAPNLYQSVPYDPIKSFAPISLVSTMQTLVFVNPSVPVRSLKELIELAKAKPGQLNYATNGVGTLPHLASELFKSLTGVNMVHVPYKGAAPGMTDLMAGRVEAMFIGLGPYAPYVRAGKIVALAVAGKKRPAQLPDVPPSAEAGVPGWEAFTWFGLVAPAATPHEMIERLNAEVRRMEASKPMRDWLTTQGMEPASGTPEEFGAFIASEYAKWGRVIKDHGIQVDESPGRPERRKP